MSRVPHKVVPAGPPLSQAPRPPAPPAPGGTRLVTRADDLVKRTANRETDARTALTRGLAEYLAQVQVEMPGGRRVAFRRVFESHAEPEDVAEFPSASVVAGVGTYHPIRFTPGAAGKDRLPEPDGRYLLQSSEFRLEMAVEVWATDPKERQALVAAVEDAMVPVDWLYGARLELPHYFGARADYQLVSMSYADDEAELMRRHRRAVFAVAASLPVLRLASFPGARIRAVAEVEEP